MLSYVIGALITCFLGIFHPSHSGPIDAALNWARADRIPIEVNLPWLPCKYLNLYIYIFFF